MGCGSSVPKHTTVDMSDWLTILIDPDTGNITTKAKEGDAVEVLAKCTLEKEADRIKGHFVQQKIGGSWEETKVGGKLKYTVITAKEFKELFDKSGAKAEFDTPDDLEKKADELSKSPSTVMTDKDAQKASNYMCCCGKAEWNDKVYLLNGEINDRVNVIDMKSGRVVLSMSQWKMASEVKFYNANVNREDRASVRKDKQKSRADEAYVGTRVRTADNAENKDSITLTVKPTMVEKIPLSLFAAAILYSSFDYNGIEC